MAKINADRDAKEKAEAESKKKTEQDAQVASKAKEKSEAESKLKVEQKAKSKSEEEFQTINGEVATHMAETRAKVNFKKLMYLFCFKLVKIYNQVILE